MASRERVVEFAVKARDEFSKVLKNLEKQQQRALSAAEKTAARRTFVGDAAKEVAKARDEYTRLTAAVDRYNASLNAGRRNGRLNAAEQRELAESIALTRARANDAAVAYGAARSNLVSLTNAGKSGFAAFDRMASTMQRTATAAVQQNVAVAATPANLNKIAAASRTAAAGQKQLQAAADGASAALNRQRGAGGNRGLKGDAQSVEVWGLKPWQLTNLGYQVNDVISGLAMGQRPMQVLAQQAGQFAQIWPNVMVTLARSIPVIAGVTAVLTPFIATALRLREVNALNREFSTMLAISADGANYSAQALTEAATAMQRFGIAASESRELVQQFVKAGIPEAEMGKYARTVTQLGELMKLSAPEAAQKFMNVDGLRQIDKELNFLTASQNAAMLAMERTGDVSGALSLAQDALAQKLRASGQAASEWDQAMRDLSSSWNDLLKSIENTGLVQRVMRALAGEFSATARDINRLVREIGEIIDYVSGNGPVDMGVTNQRIRELEDFIEATRTLGDLDDLAIERAQEELQELRKIVIARREEIEAIKDGGVQVTARVEAHQQIQKQIDLALEALAEESRLAGLTNRELFIEKNTRERINQLMRDGHQLTKEQSELIRQSVADLYDLARANEWAGGKNTGSLADKIIGVEYGDGSRYRNPNSTASGAGQFIESTWLRMFKQYFPDRAAGLVQSMGETAAKQYMLDLRKDTQLSKTMVEFYIKENSAILQQAGVAVNEASVYLAHFLGPHGAMKVLKAAPDTPVSDLLGKDVISANKSILDGKTAGEVLAWSQQKMALDERQLAIATKMGEAGEKYLADYKDRVDAQRFELDLMTKTAREAAIAKAVRDEELKAKEAGVVLSEKELSLVRELAAQRFDQQNVNAEVDKLLERRTALLESLQIATLAGDQGKIADTIMQIQSVEEQLRAAIDAAIAFWEALGGPGAEQAVANLKNIRDGLGQTLEKMEKQFLPTAIEINEQLADIGGNAFSAFAQAIANGENAAQAFFDTLLKGIADFLIEIGKAIVKQALFNALSGGVGAGGSGGIGGTIGGWISSIFHEGGVIGRSSAPTRMVNPAIFAGAQRHHTGGIVGLKNNEVPIIAMRDEEVLTTDDPRHSYNGGGGRSAVNVKNVNVFDPTDVLEAALATQPGERVLMNWLTRNARKVNGAISR